MFAEIVMNFQQMKGQVWTFIILNIIFSEPNVNNAIREHSHMYNVRFLHRKVGQAASDFDFTK